MRNLLKTATKRSFQFHKRGYHSVTANTPEPKICQFESDGFVQKSRFEEVSIPDATFDQYVWRNLQKWQDKTAIVCASTGRKYTYSRLRDCSAAFAVRLQNYFRLRHGDVIAVMLPNVPEYAIVTLGSMEIGITVTTLNPSYTQYEISKRLRLTKPRLIVTLVETFEKVQKSCMCSEIRADIVVVKTNIHQALPIGSVSLAELIENRNIDFSQLAKSDRNPDEVCILPFSSGTTGLPKGVELTHRNIVAHSQMLNGRRPRDRFVQETTKYYQDTWLSVLPQFHLSGLMQSFLCNLSLGCKIVTLPSFTSTSFLSCLMKYKPNLSLVVPPIVSLLINHDNVCRNNHLQHFRSIVCGGAPIPICDIEKLKDKAPNLDFHQVYGLTEASTLISLGHKNSSNYSSIGWPVANTEIKVVDPNDPCQLGLPVNRSGELMVRGPHIMRGYYNDIKATNQNITTDGWLRTGDMGWYDEDGFFYIKSRLKELIKVHGFQVPPAELEAIIMEHPFVLDAGVIGIKHPKCGEVPRAFVVRRPGHRFNEEEIMDFVANRVVYYKRLEGGVHFVPSIPRNPTGKILKKYLQTL